MDMKFQKFAGKYGGKIDTTKRIDPTKGPAVEFAVQEKKAKFVPHGGTAKPISRYTGVSIIGIGTMHKSNAVPIFSQEQAEDISKMRRG
jgi:hypothetical protein